MTESTIDSFSQFGLGGIVIFALFYFLHGFLRELKSMNETHDKRIEVMAQTHYTQIESMNKMHNERHDNRNDLHAKERADWLLAYKENTEVLRSLATKRCAGIEKLDRKEKENA